MKTILIAGAGQLGSRHLQGVKTSKYELDIWVYDLSNESLKVAEERYNQIESQNKTVHFVTSLDLVPSKLDVVIVATSSKPRAAIIKQILASKSVIYMVLEKFLFPRLIEYQEIEELIQENGVRTWVNCPRRMWEGYKMIAGYINKDKPVIFNYKDTNWGLCCNTVHYLDIFMWLNGCNSFSVNIDNLIPMVVESKRHGYVELHGTEQFETDSGSILTLTSTMESVPNPIVVIDNADTHIQYHEPTGIITINGNRYNVPVYYQSGLSGLLVDEILESGNCPLTRYNESASYHKAYLQVVAPYINKLLGCSSDSCPIT